MSIVTELILEHRGLLDQFDRILETGLEKPESAGMVKTLKADFTAHLEREQKDVYDLLERITHSNQGLKHILSLFIREVREIETAGTAFFAAWDMTPRSRDIDLSFARFHEAFKVRARHEEEIIFTEFDILRSYGEKDGSGI
jgi:hypothetical protein